jgi:hypothetical protein
MPILISISHGSWDEAFPPVFLFAVFVGIASLHFVFSGEMTSLSPQYPF